MAQPGDMSPSAFHQLRAARLALIPMMYIPRPIFRRSKDFIPRPKQGTRAPDKEIERAAVPQSNFGGTCWDCILDRWSTIPDISERLLVTVEIRLDHRESVKVK